METRRQTIIPEIYSLGHSLHMEKQNKYPLLFFVAPQNETCLECSFECDSLWKKVVPPITR